MEPTACSANEAPSSSALTSNETTGEAYNGVEVPVRLRPKDVPYPGPEHLEGPYDEVRSGDAGEQKTTSRHDKTLYIAYKLCNEMLERCIVADPDSGRSAVWRRRITLRMTPCTVSY